MTSTPVSYTHLAIPTVHLEDISVKTLFAGDDFTHSTLEVALQVAGKGAARLTLRDVYKRQVLCGRLGPDGVWHAFWITEVLTALVAYPVRCV